MKRSRFVDLALAIATAVAAVFAVKPTVPS